MTEPLDLDALAALAEAPAVQNVVTNHRLAEAVPALIERVRELEAITPQYDLRYLYAERERVEALRAEVTDLRGRLSVINERGASPTWG